jgi:hypothetical protein
MDKLKAEFQHAVDKWAQDTSKSLFLTFWPFIEAAGRPNERKPEPEPKTAPKPKLHKLRKGPPKPATESEEETYKPIPLKSAAKPVEQSDQPVTSTDETKESEPPLLAKPATPPQIVPPTQPPSEEIVGESEPVPMDLESKKPKAQKVPTPQKEKAASMHDEAESDEDAIDSETNQALFGTSDEEDEESKPAYRGLPRTDDNLSMLLSSCEQHQDDPSVLREVLSGLEDMFKGSFDTACMNMLVKTDAPQKLQRLPIENKEIKKKIRNLRRSWSESCARLSSPSNQTEDWQRLEKRLIGSVGRNNDQEILATLRRIGDSFPERFTREVKEEMRSLMKVAKEAARKSSHSEVKQKVKSLITRYKEKSAATEEESKEDQISRSRQQLDKKVTQIAQSNKLMAEQEERAKRGTKTADIGGPIKRRKH